MKPELVQKGCEAIARAANWLQQHQAEIVQMPDLSAHYKAPYLYAVTGNPLLGAHYADLMETRYLQADGDFRTDATFKGWAHLPCSPANRYVYPNGWIIVGLRKLGRYGAARRAMDYVRRFQSSENGGFASRLDAASGQVDPRYQDSSSTSSAGLALLACGQVDEAVRAGDFILRLLAEQPAPDRYYYCSWETGKGLMTDVWGDNDQNSLRGRKQYCLSTEADATGELTWLIGKPMKFLAKLYDETGDRRYLEGATTLFDFFHKLDEGRWRNYASCKIMWGGADLYRLTGEQRFADTTERILEWFCDSQDPSGLWVHWLWYSRAEDQPLAGSLDIVQELSAEISDTMLELSGRKL